MIMHPINVMIKNVGLAIRKTLIRRFLCTNHINITVNIMHTTVIPRNVLLKCNWMSFTHTHTLHKQNYS